MDELTREPGLETGRRCCLTFYHVDLMPFCSF